VKVVVGIGANLGDRLATMRSAVRGIEKLGSVRARSAVYETAALLAPGAPPQPHFFNAAVLLETELAPDALLDALHAIEAAHGRERREKWGPRTLDLDVLWVDGMVVKTEKLVVPHPHLRERAFALRPLLDVAPGAKDPSTRTTYRLATGNTITKMPDPL
jgi:2-amino-4-hydroxy-6-hydroxymethyldihydropteridine diphosphokinase